MTHACCDLTANEPSVVGVTITWTAGAWITAIHPLGVTAEA